VAVVVGEITDAAAIDRAVAGANAVVSALGPSMNRSATGLPGHPAAHVRQHPQLPVSHLHGVTLSGQLVPEPIHVASKRARHADPASLVHRRLLTGTIPVTEASTRAADYAAAAVTHQCGGDYHDRPPTTRRT
jgi:hypothetical protein